MASKKADYEGLRIQDFLTMAQAMAYTNYPTEDKFKAEVLPYVHVYRSGQRGGQYSVQELRELILSRIQMQPTK